MPASGGAPRARDREALIERLVDHHRHPRHHGALEGAEVTTAGGNPGCGDVITIHLKTDGGDRIVQGSFEGSGCTISQAAASILLQRINRDHPSLSEVLGISYEAVLDDLGPEVVGFRHRCATLALGTTKAAIKSLETKRRLRAAGVSVGDARAADST